MKTDRAPNISAFMAGVQSSFQGVNKALASTRRRLGALEADLRLRAAGRAPHLPLAFRSQYGEDAALWELFAGRLEGFFIEAGAFDGLSYSVTYALEAVGWTGLLVEAIPERFEQCRAARPRSRVVHAALGDRSASGTTTFHVVTDQYGGMLSFRRPTPGHEAAANTAQFPRRSVTVPYTSLDALLSDHPVEIDAAVIDVEGCELDVLGGFDLHRHRPKVLVLEDNSLGQDPGLTNYMRMAPYTMAGWVAFNRVYIRADLTDLQERAREVL